MALDPSYAFYSEGTITVTNGSDIATGDFVAWDPAVLPWDFVFPNDGTAGMSVIKEVLAVDQIRLAKPWSGPTLIDVPYTMVRWTRHTDPRLYAVRVSEYLARLKAIPENFEEVGQQVAEDAAAVASALPTIIQAASNVEADRQAAESAASTATTKAAAAAASAAAAATYDPASHLAKANNLSDLPNKATARANLGLIWRPVQLVEVTTAVTTVDVTLPAGWQMMRLTGRAIPSQIAQSNALYLRVGNGGSFFGGASDYTVSGMNQFGGSVSVANGVTSIGMNLTAETIVHSLNMLFEATLVQGGSINGLARFPHCFTRSTSYNSQGMTNGVISSYLNSATAISAIRLIMAFGDFAPGSRFTVEVI